MSEQNQNPEKESRTGERTPVPRIVTDPKKVVREIVNVALLFTTTAIPIYYFMIGSDRRLHENIVAALNVANAEALKIQEKSRKGEILPEQKCAIVKDMSATRLQNLQGMISGSQYMTTEQRAAIAAQTLRTIALIKEFQRVCAAPPSPLPNAEIFQTDTKSLEQDSWYNKKDITFAPAQELSPKLR